MSTMTGYFPGDLSGQPVSYTDGGGTDYSLVYGGGGLPASYLHYVPTSSLRAPVSSPIPSTIGVAASTGVNPTETSYSLYGHIVPLSVFGVGRIGGEIISGPWVENGRASFIISFGVPADPSGTRILREIAFDSEVVWDSTNGFSTEAFTYRFYGGTLTQAADPIESAHFDSDAVAYRPQMLLAFDNLPLANTKFGKIPYVAAVIADASGDDVNLGEAFERLAYSPWVGWTSDQFETSGITDGLANGGLIFAENAEFLATLQQFGRFYPRWDILQTDKLRLVDRGATVAADIVLDKTRLMDEINVSRQGPESVGKILELSTIDPDADYTIVPSTARRPSDPVAVTTSIGKDDAYLPAIMDASTRTAIVTLTKYHEETTRKTISGTAMAYGLEIEPGALINIRDVGDEFRTETFRVRETLHGANCTVEFGAEAILKCRTGGPPLYVGSTGPTYSDSGRVSASESIPDCDQGDLLIAVVMHRDTVSAPTGWLLVDTVSAVVPLSPTGVHCLSIFKRIAQSGDSGSSTAWGQSTAQQIAVHILAFRVDASALSVIDHDTVHIDNTADGSTLTAISTATDNDQMGLMFATDAFVVTFGLPTVMTLSMDGSTQTTPTSIYYNQMCGGYVSLSHGETTDGVISSNADGAGNGWAAISLVIG